MKERTTKYLVYAVIFLAVLNIATFSTIGYHIYRSHKEGSGAESGMKTGNQSFTGRYFRDRLELTPMQMNQFRPVNDLFRDNARRINRGLVLQRQQMLNEMKKEQPDTIKLNSMADSIGTLHTDLKRWTYRYYRDINQICTEDQKEELNKIFEAFFINDLHMGNRGNGRFRGPRWQTN